MSFLGFLLLAVAAAGLATVLSVTALSVRQARRAVRLVPRLPTMAPVSWLWRPERPAQLHRRLRRTCRSVASVLGPLPRTRRRWLRRTEPATSPLVSAAEELLEASAHVDRELVLLGRLPGRVRRQVDGELVATVAQLEQVGGRLVRVGLAWQRQLSHVTGVPAAWSTNGAPTLAGDGVPPLAALGSGPLENLADRLSALEEALRDLRRLA